jgi:hypothetical protein
MNTVHARVTAPEGVSRKRLNLLLCARANARLWECLQLPYSEAAGRIGPHGVIFLGGIAEKRLPLFEAVGLWGCQGYWPSLLGQAIRYSGKCCELVYDIVGLEPSFIGD